MRCATSCEIPKRGVHAASKGVVAPRIVSVGTRKSTARLKFMPASPLRARLRLRPRAHGESRLPPLEHANHRSSGLARTDSLHPARAGARAAQRLSPDAAAAAGLLPLVLH